MAATLAVAIPAAAQDSSTTTPSEFDGGPLPSEAFEGILPSDPSEAAELESLAPAEDPAENEESRSLYAGQSDAEALAALRATHPTLLEFPLWSPPPLGDGERFAGFADDFTALIEGPDGTEAKIHSGTPIRSSLGDGTPRLVDISLSADGAGVYAPANPLTRYELPTALDQPLRLADAGIGVRLAGAAAAEAQRVNDKLAYPNAWTNTDLLVAPLPDGFTTIQMLRSAQSPEGFTVDLELPAGAELRQTGADLGLEGAAVVLAGGESLGISPPMAWDAADTPIDTELDVLDSDSFELRIDHRDQGLAYPLALDPSYTFCSSGCANWWSDWHPWVSRNSHWQMIQGGSWGYPWPDGNSGLWILADHSHSRPSDYYWGESARWWFNAAGRGERVYRFIQRGLNHNAVNSTELMGLYDESTLRFVNGISSLTGVSPGRDNDDLSPFTPVVSGPWHYEWRLDHCFIGEPRNSCNLTDLAHARADLAGGNPILQLLITDVSSTRNEPPFSFMRTAYVYTVGNFQPPPPPPINPPQNNAPPTISGTPREGEILTGDKGSWSGTEPIAYSYEWRRCDAVGSNCSSIHGAQADRYLVNAADVGSTIRFKVNATNTGGSRSVTSSAVGPVQAAPPLPPPPNPPETTIDQGPTRTTGTFPVTFEFSSSQPASTFECQLTGSDWEPCSSPKTYSDLPDGQQVFWVRAVNAGGEKDATPAIHTWQVDGARVAQVEALAEQASPDAVAASEIADTADGQSLEPSVNRAIGTTTYTSTGTIVPNTRIAADPAQGVTIPTDGGDLSMTPTNISAAGHEGSPGQSGDVVVFPDTQLGAHTILRPQADGLESFTVLENTSAPATYSWDVALPGAEELRLNGGAVEIIDPNSNPDLAAAVAEIYPPVTLDAEGSTIPTTLSASGDRVTMTVNATGASFPVVAAPWVSVREVTTETICCDPNGQPRQVKSSRPRAFAWRKPALGYQEGWLDEDENAIAERMIKADEGGADVIRFGIGWCNVQPTEPEPGEPPQYNWSVADRLFEAAADLDIRGPRNPYKLIVHLWGAPAWATNPLTDDGNVNCPELPPCPAPPEPPSSEPCQPTNPAPGDPPPPPKPVSPPDMVSADSDLRLGQWKEFVKAFINHVKSENSRLQEGAGPLPIDLIRAVEIWNEPNLPKFWGHASDPSAAEYSAVYRQAEAGIDEAGGLPKSTRLISGGLGAQGDSDVYFRNFITRQDADTFPDGVGVHLYATQKTDPDQAVNNLVSDYERILDVVHNEALTLPKVPLWITEVGYPEDPGDPDDLENPPVPPSAETEEAQRYALREMYRRFLNRDDRIERPASIVIYRLIDAKTDQPGEDRHYFGTTRPLAEGGYEEKMSFCALARVARKPSDC